MKIAIIHRLEVFGMWYYRKIMIINYTNKVSNDIMLNKMQNRNILRDIEKRKVVYFRHITIRNKFDVFQLLIHGKIEGLRAISRKKLLGLTTSNSGQVSKQFAN